MSTLTTPGAVQRLLPRHFKLIDMAVAGHDAKTIAATTGQSISQVNLILRSPMAQTEIARRRAAGTEANVLGLDRDATLGKARSILEQAAEKAAGTLEACLDSPDGNLALRAADKILDRVFGKGADDRRGMVVNVTAEQVQLLTIALKESENVRHKVLPAHSPAANGSEGQPVDVHSLTGGKGFSVDNHPADGAQDRLGDVYQEPSDGSDTERSGSVF